jgi:hypothetical protein
VAQRDIDRRLDLPETFICLLRSKSVDRSDSLKYSDNYMCHIFNGKILCFFVTGCVFFRTVIVLKSNYFPMPHGAVNFRSGDAVCFLGGRNLIFK